MTISTTGNQLWEHSVAFTIAERFQAKFFIGIIPTSLYVDGKMPQNTFVGMQAMETLLPHEFMYSMLEPESFERKLCEAENFFISDRPRDWRNAAYKSEFKAKMLELLTDPNPRCIKLLGYFQHLPLCNSDTKKLWTSRIFQNFTHFPGDHDLSIYLRCVPRHYHFNSVLFYQTILERIQFDRIWLFLAPECPTHLGGDPSKDNLVTSVLRLLQTKYNATRYVINTTYVYY